MQKSCVAVTQPIVPRTKPNKPCDGNVTVLRNAFSVNWYFVGAPTNTALD